MQDTLDSKLYTEQWILSWAAPNPTVRVVTTPVWPQYWTSCWNCGQNFTQTLSTGNLCLRCNNHTLCITGDLCTNSVNSETVTDGVLYTQMNSQNPRKVKRIGMTDMHFFCCLAKISPTLQGDLAQGSTDISLTEVTIPKPGLRHCWCQHSLLTHMLLSVSS